MACNGNKNGEKVTCGGPGAMEVYTTGDVAQPVVTTTTQAYSAIVPAPAQTPSSASGRPSGMYAASCTGIDFSRAPILTATCSNCETGECPSRLDMRLCAAGSTVESKNGVLSCTTALTTSPAAVTPTQWLPSLSLTSYYSYSWAAENVVMVKRDANGFMLLDLSACAPDSGVDVSGNSLVCSKWAVGGSYTSSCFDIRVVGTVVSATCGGTVTAFDTARCARGSGLDNVGGHLLCNKWPVGGSYTSSCHDIVTTGNVETSWASSSVTAVCSSAGKLQWSTLKLNNCLSGSTLSNNGGYLTCESPVWKSVAPANKKGSLEFECKVGTVFMVGSTSILQGCCGLCAGGATGAGVLTLDMNTCANNLVFFDAGDLTNNFENRIKCGQFKPQFDPQVLEPHPLPRGSLAELAVANFDGELPGCLTRRLCH